jgi:hypothetical protein
MKTKDRVQKMRSCVLEDSKVQCEGFCGQKFVTRLLTSRLLDSEN